MTVQVSLYSFPEHDNFCNTDILQGSVATCLRCGGMFSNYFTADLLENLTVKEFENWSRLDRVTAISLVSFSEHGVDCCFTLCINNILDKYCR